MIDRFGASLRPISLSVLSLLAALCPVFASPSISALTPSSPSPQPVGTTITWTATATDTSAGQLAYRFSIKAPGASNFFVVRDFHPSSTFQWTPSQSEGVYGIQVQVQNLVTNAVSTLSTAFRASTLITGAGPVVSVTGHPLVALYSAPPCPVGSSMVVSFKAVGSAASAKTTNQKNCTGNSSMNFYLAPMAPNTQYLIVHKVITGSNAVSGPNMSFTAGSIPSSISALIAPTTVVRPVTGLTSTEDDIVLLDNIAGTTSERIPTATNLNGNTIWYYPARAPQISRFFIRPLAGGTMLITLDDPTITVPNTLFQASQILREFDLAGNTVRETNVTRVAAQLAVKYPAWNICNWSSPAGCAPGQTAMLDFHHDAIRLPNGHTAVLMTMERVFTNGIQGSSPSNPVDIIADMVVELDVNMQVRWAWNSYIRENLNRPALLGETCTSNGPGCPPLNFMAVANDWLHSNSISYTSDGNILISQRHQDFVNKINFADGTGSGNIMWRMGRGGDFKMTGTSDPFPWFSHQHHAGFDVPGQPVMSLFDNGNTRVSPPPVGLGSGNSRGMVLYVNEASMAVTPILLTDLGTYSAAVGSAQRLNNVNHNYSFGSGFVTPGPNGYSQSVEVVGVPSQTGTLDYTLQGGGSVYRIYRLPSFYTGFAK